MDRRSKASIPKERTSLFRSSMPTGVYERTEKHREALRDNLRHFHGKGELSPAWKGDKVCYRALHLWVERNLGKPKLCSFCEDRSARRFHWSNISGKYAREFSDWIRLCPPCHSLFDSKVRPILRLPVAVRERVLSVIKSL